MDGAERIAVVDLGTNSTRLLVADVDAGGGLRKLERRTRVTRLGDGVDSSGRLTDAAMERVFDTLAEYRSLTDDRSARRAIAVATSAVRDASNGDAFEAAVRERFGFDSRTISGEEEARLTFLGATAGRRASGTTLVIDIGGGSTEYVVGNPGEPPSFHVSTQLGSVRQTERHLPSDPPGEEEVDALRSAAGEIVAEAVPPELRASVGAGIAVAGTATSLAAIDQQLEPYDPERVDGYAITAAACARMLSELAGLALEERKRVPGLHPDRAPTIVAGAAILLESMHAFALDAVEVSEADLLHGAALDAVASGLGHQGEAG